MQYFFCCNNIVVGFTDDFGEGTRVVIWFNWAGLDKQAGHAIVGECQKSGVVNFGDPQRKIRRAIKILESAELNTIGILRIDNLKFTDVVKRCCVNRSKLK